MYKSIDKNYPLYRYTKSQVVTVVVMGGWVNKRGEISVSHNSPEKTHTYQKTSIKYVCLRYTYM